MKNVFTLLLLGCLVWSCTSENNHSTPSNSNNNGNAPLDSIAVYSNDKLLYSTGKYYPFYKSENTIYSKFISFNKAGHFGYLKVHDDQPISPNSLFYSPFDYSSNYVNFQLISLDTIQKRVKFSFSGYLRTDPFNVMSEQRFVRGYCDKPYTDVPPLETNIIVKARINGQNWVRTNNYMKRKSTSMNRIVDHEYMDDSQKLTIHFDVGTTTANTYNFDVNSTTNKVVYHVYDPTSKTYTSYNCQGQIIFEKGVTGSNQNWNIFKGTFSFTAINPNNPNDIKTIDNGYFKVIYQYFDANDN